MQTTLVALGQQNSLIIHQPDLENITQLPQILTVMYTFPTVEITHRVAETYIMQLIYTPLVLQKMLRSIRAH